MPELAGTRAAELDRLPDDDAAWDDFVERAGGQYLQLSAWREVKRANGWRAVRLISRRGEGQRIGAQVLLRRLRPLPVSLGYAPAAPVGPAVDGEGLAALTDRLRELARREGLSHITLEPLVADDALAEALLGAGWRRAARLQVDRTWVVDLGVGEEALWRGLRSKWRQYVQKARREGFAVVDAGADGVDELYEVLVATARRAGFPARSRASYRHVYDAYAASGRARVVVCRAPGGGPAAALMLLTCGGRVIEPYGGMTDAGAAGRANYLLKWEAMRSSLERGYAVYDMWGMATPGIAHFKQGFGGREVANIGAFDLVARPLARSVFLLARGASLRLGRLRRRSGAGEAAE